MATHTVARGERLSEIAALHGVPVENIVAANPNKPRTQLRSGAVVFSDLSEGETIGLGALPRPKWGRDREATCPVGQAWLVAPNGAKSCAPIAVVEWYQSNGGLRALRAALSGGARPHHRRVAELHSGAAADVALALTCHIGPAARVLEAASGRFWLQV
jgi:hypothetical protein